MKIKEFGITLISLVIIIVVIFIITGVTVTLSIGDEGVLDYTRNTIELYQESTELEQQSQNEFVQNFNQLINKK